MAIADSTRGGEDGLAALDDVSQVLRLRKAGDKHE
jgi:hypothetical protein